MTFIDEVKNFVSKFQYKSGWYFYLSQDLTEDECVVNCNISDKAWPLVEEVIDPNWIPAGWGTVFVLTKAGGELAEQMRSQLLYMETCEMDRWIKVGDSRPFDYPYK